MALQIFILLAGLSLILFGANWLVDGSSSIAKRFGILLPLFLHNKVGTVPADYRYLLMLGYCPHSLDKG